MEGTPPPISHFDVDIDPIALDKIIVTLGPLATEGDKLIVEALLKEYTKNRLCKDSVLKNDIRIPIR